MRGGKSNSISKVMGGQDCSELGVMALATDSDLKTLLMGGRIILNRLRIRRTIFHKSTEASRLGSHEPDTSGLVSSHTAEY